MRPCRLANRGMRALALALALLALPELTACSSGLSLLERGLGGGDSRPLAVDQGAAAAMVTAFRRQQGLGAVSVSPTLAAIARRQADAMAAHDEMSHTVANPFERRLESGGYRALSAAENLGAGYGSLAEVMAGWEKSADHRANLLKGSVSEIGIAAAESQSGRKRVYWALVLGTPLS